MVEKAAIIEALHEYAVAIRVAGTEEAADRATDEFFRGMDVAGVVGRDAAPAVTEAMRHAYSSGFQAGLREAARLGVKALERAA